VGAYIVRRVLLLIPTLIIIYTITFVVMHATPGGPFDAAGDKPLPAATRKNLEKKYGLDKPLWQQYFVYLNNLRQGDLGPSYAQRNRQVTEIIRDTFPISAQLGLVAVVISVIFGIGLGVVAAVRQNSIVDYAAMLFATVGISLPTFVTAAVLVWLLSLTLNLVPTNGWNGILDKRVIIPAIALSFIPIATFARYTRASVLGILRQDYVRTARAKGVSERAVLGRHVLRNALIPIATVAGVQFVFIATGSFYVETVCNIPGIGSYFVRSATGRDYGLLMALTLLFAVLIVIANLVVDILYAWLDPRISYN
jgi:ABC-type dipeptide/oligopeptide/nickel transport system permease component